MKYEIQYLKDVNGNNYIGLNIPAIDIQKYLNYCFDNIPDFDQYNQNLLKRNHGLYHITMFNVGDYHKNKEQLDNIIGTEIECIFKGIGSLTDETTNNTTYYVVVESYIINTIRSLFNLSDITPHVTIGFIQKDIIKNVKNVCNVLSC